MTVASAVIDQRVPHRRLLDQVRRALLGQRPAAVLQDHVVLGRARRLDHVLGVPAVGLRIARGLREPRAPSRADPVRRRRRSPSVQMFFLFLMVVHKNPFTTFLTDGAGRRRRAEPAAAELLDGDPSAVALHRLRRHDDSVRVRHRGAHHRPPRRLVAARRAPLDDVQLAVPVVRPDARDDLGVRRARVGRLLGLGSGRERRRCCRGSRRPRSCTR